MLNGMEGQKTTELKFDRTNLYREEAFTDLRVGSIRRLTPVNADGTPDVGRKPLFSATAQIMSPAGPLPIQAQIDAATLEEAMDKFPAAINAAVEDLIREAEEMRRQESSRIVVPGREPMSKIKLR